VRAHLGGGVNHKISPGMMVDGTVGPESGCGRIAGEGASCL
jgi:hypothetical protein